MDLSIIFEDDIEIRIPIENGNEKLSLLFKFQQPTDFQTLKVLKSIEDPQQLQELGEKYAEYDEEGNELPSSSDIKTLIATQEAVYSLMQEVIIEAPMYDEKKYKSFLDYFNKLDRGIRREVYTEFMSIAVGSDGGDASKKFIISNSTTLQPLEAEEL